MTDAPEPPPEQRLPAPRPPDRVSAERFTAAPSLKAIDGLTAERSAGIVRQSSSARWVGFLTVAFVTLFIVGYWFYELGFPLGISEPRLAAGDRASAGDRGRAGLQRLPGELRPLPRSQRPWARRAGRGRGRLHRPDAQRPGEAVRPPQRELPAQRAAGRWPVCLRQRQVGDAGLVGPGQSARSAQLPPDRRAHRVPPGDERPRLRREGPGAERAGDRSRDRRGEDVHRLARPELQAGPGRDALSRLLPRRARRRRCERCASRLDRPERPRRHRLGARRRGDAPGSSRTRSRHRPTRRSPSSSTTRTRPRPTTSSSRTRAGRT